MKGWEPLPPGATAPDLARLAEHPHPGIREAVAAHPNSPPALPLLRLAHPELLVGWPSGVLLRLGRLPEAPEWVHRVALARGGERLHLAVAAHSRLTEADGGSANSWREEITCPRTCWNGWPTTRRTACDWWSRPAPTCPGGSGRGSGWTGIPW